MVLEPLASLMFQATGVEVCRPLVSAIGLLPESSTKAVNA
jgi:hypothetical protein